MSNPSDPPTPKPTILIVEDEVPMLNALHDKLTREGFSVLTARNGEEGLKVALRDRPDLILLDVVMPRMDGITMLRKLRRESAWGRTARVIVLTNLSSDNEQRNRDITETEPAFYLVKANWTLKDVVAKIRERLSA